MTVKHWLGLTDARVIKTPPFADVQTAVSDLVEAQAMGAVYGDAGLGKTFAVEYAIERVDVPACRLVFPRQATPKQITVRLLEALTGVREEGERRRLQRTAVDVLAECPRLVVVDEAQRLDSNCIDELRFLWEEPETQLTLLLVGGNGCMRSLQSEPMLFDRIYREVGFIPMTAEEVLKAIPSYHPLYKDVDKELLLLIDDTYAHGHWRKWAKFTKSAQQACRRNEIEGLDEDGIRGVFGTLGGKKVGTP